MLVEELQDQIGWEKTLVMAKLGKFGHPSVKGIKKNGIDSSWVDRLG